jgi:hypothetical protein
MKRLLFLALLCPLALSAQVVTRDTTIYTATRIRTAANGNILSISVAKIATPAVSKTDTVKIVSPPIHDTVKVATPPIHDTVTVTRVAGRDTVAWWPSQVANRFTFSLVAWDRGRGQPAPFLIPTIIVHDTVTLSVVHDTVTRVVHDTVMGGPGPAAPTYGYFWWTPSVRYDTVFFIPDSSRTRPLALQSPPAKTIIARDVPGSAQPPRTFMNTRMPVMPIGGDTLYQDPVTHVWKCKGPTCAAAAGRIRLLNHPRTAARK